MVWKIGPECIAQQAKKVSARTMNGGERSAAPSDMSVPTTPAPDAVVALRAACSRGGLRTSIEAGTSKTAAKTPIVNCALRQSSEDSSQPANGDMVIGAT